MAVFGPHYVDFNYSVERRPMMEDVKKSIGAKKKVLTKLKLESRLSLSKCLLKQFLFETFTCKCAIKFIKT